MNNNNTFKLLSQLKKGEGGTIVKLTGDDAALKKLSALGMVEGAQVLVMKARNPFILSVAGTTVAAGLDIVKHITVDPFYKNILLIGNPNAGKSQVFTRLTGVKAISSNFPGTTVSVRTSPAEFNKTIYNVVDVPGVYRLEDDSIAGKETAKVLAQMKYELIVYVLDANHLERSLFFGLEILALKKPVLFLLNKYKTAQTSGTKINMNAMSAMLGVPVAGVEALTGEGFKELENIISAALKNSQKVCSPACQTSFKDEAEKWRLIGEIVKKSQSLEHKHMSALERLAEMSTRPLTGLPIALVVMAISFFVIRFAGEGLINLLTPLFENYYAPFITGLFGEHTGGFWGTMLLGGGDAFGLLTDAAQIAFIDVLSYVVAFYAVFEFWADLGYLPRLSVLLDSVLHKIGIHGYGVIPIMMGLGCKVPAVMAVRTLESRRERVIATALVLLLAPCITQSAMIFVVLGSAAWYYTVAVFGALLIAGISAGVFLNKIMKGNPPAMFMEIPSWQMPKITHWLAKVWLRVKEYIKEAIPMIMLGIVLINIAVQTGALDLIARLFRLPVEVALGLPGESVSVIILGFLRKDVSIALLEPFALNPGQLVTACVFMSMYLPCAATFFVMLKEMGVKDTLKICALTFGLAFITAALLHFGGQSLGV